MWLANSTAAIDLNSLVGSPNWTLVKASSISDTGFINGEGLFDPDAIGLQQSFERTWSILVPQAGTYGLGDANFDTEIGFADLVILAQHYNESNPNLNVNVADFNLNGITDFQDLVTLSQNYTSTVLFSQGFGSDRFAADWALAQSFVPEPGCIAVASALPPLCRRRRNPKA
jgi:hypothetical protein